MTRITESNLILPSLFLMSLVDNGFISTTNLRHRLRDLLQPSGMDEEIIANRNDTYFDQKVRNLISHETLTSKEYVVREGSGRSAGLRITEHGRMHCEQNKDYLKYIVSTGFEWNDIKEGLAKVSNNENKKMLFFDENIFIKEGTGLLVTTVQYQRSSELHLAAFAFHSKNDRIICSVCDFDFEKQYGSLGKGYIEIHHMKPLYMYLDEDKEQSLGESIKNTVALCANCHRMVHRKRPPYMIDKIKESILHLSSTVY